MSADFSRLVDRLDGYLVRTADAATLVQEFYAAHQRSLKETNPFWELGPTKIDELHLFVENLRDFLLRERRRICKPSDEEVS